MKDSEDSKNAKMDVSKDAEPAAFELENRRLAGDKHGLGRRRISDEQRQEILNELFFEGEERMPYVKHFYSLLTVSTLIASYGPGEEFPFGGDRRHVALALDDTHPGIRFGPRHGMAHPIRSSCNTFVFSHVICFWFSISFAFCFWSA